jgi:hypothetical protein
MAELATVAQMHPKTRREIGRFMKNAPLTAYLFTRDLMHLLCGVASGLPPEIKRPPISADHLS